MTKYQIKFTKQFKKSYKKLNPKLKDEVLKILELLANDVPLEAKFKDHPLSGNLSGFRDCHIRPDLVLIYEKDQDILTLTAVNVGNHGNVF
ncbi:type II toxin-antitoxin system YafQ family toxin [Campylobacter geochelonis]|uniref:type II toxin-antitoxin system YafQ family toxin n=1 Tax=Campylobacter geochelonis TaxID=1780362 RepID=UPI00094D7921|nr:type II toxin-antitoxin system YafQ family toxin [Campylobacter geochelonis]